MPNPYVDPKKRYAGGGEEPQTPRPSPMPMEEKFKFALPTMGSGPSANPGRGYGFGTRGQGANFRMPGGFGGRPSIGSRGSNPLGSLLDEIMRKRKKFDVNESPAQPTQDRLLARYLGGSQ